MVNKQESYQHHNLNSPLIRLLQQKQELYSSTISHQPATSIDFQSTFQSLPITSETDDILECKAIQRKELESENKILVKITVFKSPHETNIDEFLSQAEDIF